MKASRPASPELPCVLADRAQIERVVSNLVSHALRHTEPGGRIHISAVRRDGQVAVSVMDSDDLQVATRWGRD